MIESSAKPLGVLSPVGSYPPIKGFVLSGGGLGLVLGDLYPLLYKSQVWFKSVREVLRREVMGFEVGSGDLEKGASSNVGKERTGVDTATSAPSSSQPSVLVVVRSFHALKEKCSLKIEVFSKFKDRFQFPEGTRAHLPRKDEKACAFAHGEVCFYKATFSCGLRFPVHPFIMKLLHYLNLAPGQLMPNSWRILISCMVIWTTIDDGDMLTVNEFVHLYCLKESKEFGYYEFIPWDRKSRLVADLPSSFRYWKSRYFFLSGDGWETLSDDFWGDVPRLLCQWKTPLLSAFAPQEMLPFPSLFSFILAIIPDLFLLLHSIAKDRPKLKGRFGKQVQAVVEYARTIEDFNKLIDPRTLARHCLGPEPSLYVLSTLDWEEKKYKLPLYIGRPPFLFFFFFFLSSLFSLM